MPEHLIRLRKGWESIDLDATDPLPERITLPLSCGWGSPRRLRLTRRFGRPPLDPRIESLWLRLDCVPGLDSLRLNDRDMTFGPGVEGPIEIPLAELPDRNELVLEISGATVPSMEPGAIATWGEIALLIRSGPA